MTQFLPSNLLALFAPREPLKYLPPAAKLPIEKNLPPYSGVATFVAQFENPKDCPPPTRVETKDERKERQKKERSEQIAYKLEQDLALWDPSNDPKLYGDPFKTLFCSRINYDTSESKLRREFDVYGPVKKIHLVMNSKTGKPRGYAFVEFEHERDMHAAYKHADGKKIDGRRVLVDVERGRTVKGWRPRRLGGGLGNTRKGGTDVNTRYSGREDFIGRDRDIPDDRRGLESRGMSPPDRGRRSRSRGSRDRAGRRRSRSPKERERERERRRRSRERRRSTERDVVKKEPLDEADVKQEPGVEDDKEVARKQRSRRSRSRDRARRSRSRDRKRSRRSRGKDRRERSDRRRAAGDHGGGSSGANGAEPGAPPIKQELDNLGEYETAGANLELKTERDGEEGEEGYNRLEDL